MVPASDKVYTARILERRDLSEDLLVIRVDPGGPFQFKAGQYTTLARTTGTRELSVRIRSCLRRMKKIDAAGIRSIQDRVESPWQSRSRSRK